MNYAQKRTMKQIVSIVLTVLLIAGLVFGLYSLFSEKKTKEISALAFSVGALDANGKYKESKESIYTKNAFECQGLKVTPKFECQVSYEIYFYDQDGVFIEKTGKLTTVYKEVIPLLCTHARVVITPIEDESVSLLEVTKYARQLKIEVNKTQKTLPSSGLTRVETLLGVGVFGPDFVASPTSPLNVYSIDTSKANSVFCYLETSAIGSTLMVSNVSVIVPVFYLSDSDILTYTVVSTYGDYTLIEIDCSTYNTIYLCYDKTCDVYAFA